MPWELGQFAICGHSFGGPYVAACAYRLADRITSAAIVAGISPLSFDGATRGMPAPVRLVLWLGGHAPVIVRPYVSLMARMVKKPDTIAKGIGSLLPDDEVALLETPRFDGFFENFDEMVKHGSKGAYWDARVFLGEWGFDCTDIEMPVSLFYGTDDQNVPIQMGEYYRDANTYHGGDLLRGRRTLHHVLPSQRDPQITGTRPPITSNMRCRPARAR